MSSVYQWIPPGEGVIIPVMTHTRKPRPVADKQDKPHVLFIKLPDAMEEAFQKFLNAQRVKPTRTAAALVAIEELLTREGYWSPARG